MNLNPRAWSAAEQYAVAEWTQTLLGVLAAVFFGFAGGYYMSISRVTAAGCGAVRAPELCAPALASLNEGLLWCLVAGLVALTASGTMNYLLQRVDV